MHYAEDFVTALNSKFNTDLYEVQPGRKYDRIVKHYRPGDGGSAFAFVDRGTGDLIKPGGWAKPQRDKNGLAVRFNLERSFELAVHAADPYGSFLYKR